MQLVYVCYPFSIVTGASLNLPKYRSVLDTVHAAAAASDDSLPAPAFSFVFGVLRAILGWPQHTLVHEEALAVLAQQVPVALQVFCWSRAGVGAGKALDR